MKQIAATPKNPSQGTAALRGLAHTWDAEVLEDAWRYMMEDVRVTDLCYMIAAMGYNPRARRFLVERFKADYELLNKKYEGNYGFQDIIEVRTGKRSHLPVLMGKTLHSMHSTTSRLTRIMRTS